MTVQRFNNSYFKPLNIDFNLYTDGDEEFKQELVVLMIENLQELQGSLQATIKENKVDILSVCTHKIKVTLAMIDDKDVNQLIEEIKTEFSDVPKRNDNIRALDYLCSCIIRTLSKDQR
jgi:hypothetical protein